MICFQEGSGLIKCALCGGYCGFCEKKYLAGGVVNMGLYVTSYLGPQDLYNEEIGGYALKDTVPFEISTWGAFLQRRTCGPSCWGCIPQKAFSWQ